MVTAAKYLLRRSVFFTRSLSRNVAWQQDLDGLDFSFSASFCSHASYNMIRLPVGESYLMTLSGFNYPTAKTSKLFPVYIMQI